MLSPPQAAVRITVASPLVENLLNLSKTYSFSAPRIRASHMYTLRRFGKVLYLPRKTFLKLSIELKKKIIITLQETFCLLEKEVFSERSSIALLMPRSHKNFRPVPTVKLLGDYIQN